MGGERQKEETTRNELLAKLELCLSELLGLTLFVLGIRLFVAEFIERCFFLLIFGCRFKRSRCDCTKRAS